METVPSQSVDVSESEIIEKDQICCVCNEWCLSHSDFQHNFVSCTSCPQSYHKSCLHTDSLNSLDGHDSNKCYECHQRLDKHHNRLSCVQMVHSRSARLLWRILNDDPYCPKHYCYDGDEHPVYWHPENKEKERQYQMQHLQDGQTEYQIYTRSQYTSIEWKGVRYRIGDCIEINKPPDMFPWHTDVVMIEKIFVYDEPDVPPSFSIYWFWRERELQYDFDEKHLSRDIVHKAHGDHQIRYIDSHVYLDIDYKTNPQCPDHDEVQLVDVKHKVLVCSSFSDFRDSVACCFAEFGRVFWGDVLVNSDNIELGKMPFFDVDNYDLPELQDHIRTNCREKQIIGYRDKGKKLIAKEGKQAVTRWLEQYHIGYSGDDEEQCMCDHTAPKEVKMPLQMGRSLVLTESDPSPTSLSSAVLPKTAKPVPVSQPKTKKSVRTKPKDILEKNEREISSESRSKMERICQKLGIAKGVNIAVSIYGFKGHLEVYQALLQMVRLEEKEWTQRVEGLTSNQLRDIKSKIGSKGKCGRKEEMKDGITVMLRVLQDNYRRYVQQKKKSPRKSKKKKKRRREGETERDGKRRKIASHDTECHDFSALSIG